MKKYFLFLLFSMFICQFDSSAQIQEPQKDLTDRELGEYYLQKNRSQKTTAWVLLGGGTVLSIVGMSSFEPLNNNNSNVAGVLMLIGSIAQIGSVPLFISAAKNKGRAEILLRRTNVPISALKASPLNIASAGVAISIGRK